MTLSTTTNRVSYDGDGSTIEFPFVFKFLNKSAIKVVLLDALGVETLLTITTHYTLTDPADSGTVTMISAPAIGETLVIYREVALTQTYDPVEGGSFPVDAAEDAWDKNVMGLQQIDDKIGRAPLLKVSSAYGAGALILPEPSDNAGKVIGFSAGGDQMMTYSPSIVYAANIDSIQNYSDNLATAVSQIGAAKKTLVIDKAITVTANLTIPANIHVWSLKGCEITVNNDVTLTLKSYHANAYKTFNLVGTGLVVFDGFNAVEEVYPQWWGAQGDGIADDTAAILAAINSMTTTGGLVQLLAGSYKTTEIIFVPSGIILRGMGPAATSIIPSVNVNVIDCDKNTTLEGFKIDTSGITFTSACLYYSGVKQFFTMHNTYARQLCLYGAANSGEAVLNTNGIGIKLHCSNDVAADGWPNVVGVVFEDIMIEGMDDGILLKAEDSTGPTSLNASININTFSRILMDYCDKYITLNSEDGQTNMGGNSFTDINVQARALSTYGIKVGGYNQGGNLWRRVNVLDWTKSGAHAANPHDGFILDTGSTKNAIMESNNKAREITNKGTANFIENIGSMNYREHGNPYVGIPGLKGYRVAYGNANDTLFFADERFSVTSSVAPDTGSIANVFDQTNDLFARWNAATINANPVIIKIAFGASLDGWHLIGCIFQQSRVPSEVKFEYSDDDETNYYTLQEFTRLTQESQNQSIHTGFSNTDAAAGTDITHIKITLTNAPSGATYVELGRIWGFNHHNQEGYYLPAKGGQLFGDVQFSGVGLKKAAFKLRTKTTELTGMSGVTVTWSNAIPSGSIVFGVSCRVTTLIEGANYFDVGESGADTDLFLDNINVALGTIGTLGNANAAFAAPKIYKAGISILITAVGGAANFSAGALRLVLHYAQLIAPSS